MKKITKMEFESRVKALQNARAIFSNLTDNNITKSFEAYQLILAEEERPIFLSTKDEIEGDKVIDPVEKELDQLCPACQKVKLVKYKPCCGSPKGYIRCSSCGYKILPA